MSPLTVVDANKITDAYSKRLVQPHCFALPPNVISS